MQERLISLSDRSLSRIQLDNFHYDLHAISLILSSAEEIFKLTFEWVYSFRVTDEGNLLKMLDYFDGQMTTGLYKVANSSYLQWFHEQSANIHDACVEHYLVVTNDDVIDIITSAKPLFESLSEPKKTLDCDTLSR